MSSVKSQQSALSQWPQCAHMATPMSWIQYYHTWPPGVEYHRVCIYTLMIVIRETLIALHYINDILRACILPFFPGTFFFSIELLRLYEYHCQSGLPIFPKSRYVLDLLGIEGFHDGSGLLSADETTKRFPLQQIGVIILNNLDRRALKMMHIASKSFC